MKKYLVGVAIAAAVALVPASAGAVVVDKNVSLKTMQKVFRSGYLPVGAPFNAWSALDNGKVHTVALWEKRLRAVLVADQKRLHVMATGHWTPTVAASVKTFDTLLTKEITWWKKATQASTYQAGNHLPTLAWQKSWVAAHNKAAATANKIRKMLGLQN